ncbi:MAG TPA: iron ABC transporter permease [Geobacteraceae bacterium]|nr:iron ABC transporter permease [Geobacteraceae bacterium]
MQLKSCVKNTAWIPGLFFLLVASVIISLTLGKYPLSLEEIFGFLSTSCGFGSMDGQKYELFKNIIVDIRLPRILAAVLIGAALSVSGASFQSMFINPLVSPSLLGVLSGASFGAALGMIVSHNWFAVQSSSFLFGFVAVLISVGIARLYRGDRLLMLILGGIISGALFTSLLSIVKYVADPYNQLPAIVNWLMGGLSMADGNTVLFTSIPIGIGVLVIVILSPYLNILSMGDDEAKTLGVNVAAIRMTLIFFATLISAMTVVVGGMIGWVGLIIPHVSRMLVGPDNRLLLPVSALIGAFYLVGVDDVSRLLFNVEIPLGIVTSLVGIPFFALVLKNARKGWG